MMASADTTPSATPSSWTNDSTATADASTTAVGGPYDPVVGATPTSTSSYPPCDGSEGDDSCIQLYERGVSSDGN